MSVDARQRYRVEFDRACERGEVDPTALAKGECAAWNDYLRGAEMVERTPEEWELDRWHGNGFWLNGPHGRIFVTSNPGVRDTTYFLVNHSTFEFLNRESGGLAAWLPSEPDPTPFFGIDRTASTEFLARTIRVPRQPKPSRVPSHIPQRRLDGRRWKS